MIGQRIAYFRLERRLSQEAVARAVGIQQTLISRIERGKRKVTADEVVKFAKVYQIDVKKLLEEELQCCEFCHEPLENHSYQGLCPTCTKLHYN